MQELEKKVMASAQRSRTSYMDAASSIAKLGQNASDAFGSMDEVIAFQELINKSFVIGGASVPGTTEHYDSAYAGYGLGRTPGRGVEQRF